MSSGGSGGDDARDGKPEAGAGSEQEVSMEQETASSAVQAKSTPGDQSPALHIGDDEENMLVDEHSEFMQNFDVDGILESLNETHGSVSDQRSTVTHPQHQAEKSPPEEPDPKHPRLESDEAETTASTQVSNLPYPLVDTLVFKDAIPGLQIDLVDRQAHMVRTIGPRYKLCGAVAQFQHVSSFVDNNLVDERQGTAATVAACVDADDWYPVSDIAGAVIGCDPQEVHLFTEPVWTYIQGLIVSARVGPYPILGLYTGIDVTGLQRNQFASDEEFRDAEILLAQDQGTAFARFAALAAQHHMQLTIYCADGQGHPCSSIDVALHLLKRVPGFSRTNRICVSQFLYFPQQAERFLREFPNTVFGITRDFTENVDRDTADWVKTVPWQFFVLQSTAPFLRGFADADGDCNDSSDCIRDIARQLARISGDDAAVIVQRTTEAAIANYGLLAANRQLLEGTRPNGSQSVIDKPTMGAYHQRLQSRAGGPPQPLEATEDVINGVQMPATPWNLPLKAVDRPEPARAVQPGPLPEFNEFVVEEAEPAQPEPFRVNDRTQTFFEYLRRCPDHGKDNRHHPNIRTLIESWPKFERDSKVTAEKRQFRTRLGNRTVNCFGKAHLVFAASRFMRHHPDRVVDFLDAITATWDKQALEAHVKNFYRDVRGSELMRSQREILVGTRRPEEAINAQAIGFGPSEGFLALRIWSIRCEPAYAYYVDHPHGPAFYDTEFLNSDFVEPGLRQSFRSSLIEAFSLRMDHARLRFYLEEVTREHSQPLLANGEPDWPPKLLSYQVDYRRTYWSETVVLMDDWSRIYYGPKLRKDVDALQLEADPDAVGDLVYETFFAGSVERIVVMWGKDALDKGFAGGIIPLFEWMANHLPDNFSAARIYFVAPPFVYYQMDGWRKAVLSLINSTVIKNRVTVVYDPLDMRLMKYYETHGPGAAWPAEVLSLMDKSVNLSPEGLRERKEHMVENYGLRLWTDDGLQPFSMLTEEQLIARSRANSFATTRHFGVPTVNGTDWDKMPKPTAKKAWKPKSSTASKQGSQQSLQGNQGQRDRRQSERSEVSETSLGGYPAVRGSLTPSVSSRNRPTDPSRNSRKRAPQARSTSRHSGRFAQTVNPPRADQLPPPPRATPDQAGPQPLTLEQVQQLVQQSLAQQRAELEASWAAQRQFHVASSDYFGYSRLSRAHWLLRRRGFSVNSRLGDSSRTPGVNAEPLHLERELGAIFVSHDVQLRQLLNPHLIVDGFHRDHRLRKCSDHHPLRRHCLEGLVEAAAPLIAAGRCRLRINRLFFLTRESLCLSLRAPLSLRLGTSPFSPKFWTHKELRSSTGYLMCWRFELEARLRPNPFPTRRLLEVNLSPMPKEERLFTREDRRAALAPTSHVARGLRQQQPGSTVSLSSPGVW